jgi:hypothetical protein
LEQLDVQKDQIKDAQDLIGFTELLSENQDILREKLRTNAPEADGGFLKDSILI